MASRPQFGARVCRNAYKALDVRSAGLLRGIEMAKAQLRQLLQDVAMVEPGQGRGEDLLTHHLACPGPCLDLSSHDAWAAASPLVRRCCVLRVARGHAPFGGSVVTRGVRGCRCTRSR